MISITVNEKEYETLLNALVKAEDIELFAFIDARQGSYTIEESCKNYETRRKIQEERKEKNESLIESL